MQDNAWSDQIKMPFWTSRLKCYESLYFSAKYTTKLKSTRIHNYSSLSKKSATRNVTYPCIFLAFHMYARKIQGYMIFQMITLFSSKICDKKNTRIHNISNLLLNLLFRIVGKTLKSKPSLKSFELSLVPK